MSTETLVNALLVDFKYRFPFIRDSIHNSSKECVSLAASQLMERMYSGAKYSGCGRHKDVKLGSHSSQGNVGSYSERLMTHKTQNPFFRLHSYSKLHFQE